MNHENEGVDGSRKQELMQRGNECYKTKQYQEALDAYEEVIQLDSNDAVAYVGKGDCLRQLGHHGQAVHIYEQALAIDPTNILAHVGSSYALVELGEYERASLAYRKVIRLDPNNASAYNVAGRIRCSQARNEEALQAFEEAIRLATADHNLAEFYNDKGIALCRLKRYQGALEAFIKALQLNPGNDKYRDYILLIPRYERFKKANHYCDQADVLTSQHRYKEALRLFYTAFQIDSDHIRACIGRGYALLFCHFYKEALLTFDKHLQIYPRRIQALLGKGIALYALRSFGEALKSFEQAILLDNQLVHAYVAKGHAYVALNLPMDALKCYGEAIDLGTDDISCYINVGKILLESHGYEEVIRMYEKAFQLIPGLRSTYREQQNTLFKSSWYGQYLTASRELIRQECANIATYLSMEETLTTLGFHDEAAEALEEALMQGLTRDSGDIGQIRSLIKHPQTERRPAHIQFELLQRYITYDLTRPQRRNVIERISSLYPELFEINNVLTDIFQRNVQTLNSLLLSIPIEERAEVLTHIAGNDDIRLAQLLIYLAPFSMPGLAKLAHQVTLRWVITPRNDDLVIRFYHVLESYSVPFEDADWLFAQELMLEGLYIQAKSVLADLVKQRPTPKRLWLLATAMWHRNDPAREQIEVLHQFIASSVSSDTRCGEAWKRIGELSLEINESVAAIVAFQEASRYIDSIPQLELYRSGNWEALPGLRTHPDFAFPVIVVVDLECDYQPNAADGSRVFEIAAVRVKGHTELDTCNLVIRRDFPSKVSHRQNEAVEPKQAASILQEFIGSSIVVGHNLQGFDVKHLRGMEIEIDDNQIIDTLSFARLLYPDSVHHHLALLCEKHSILPRGEWHTALSDARACADLLWALGDELVRRGGLLLAGFRAFVPPGSAFDRAVLQSRGITADSKFFLDPSPTMPHILAPAQQESASPSILAALEQHIDALVERYDPSGAYVQHLPVDQRAIVVVNSRARLERMLAQSQDTFDLFVLPDPRTLLCPHRLRHAIEQAQNWQVKLALFCLYQASHNHDACTLYPLRLPADDPFLDELKQTLLESCCISDWQHLDSCPGMLAAKAAAENHRLVFATHESFLHQPNRPEADVIIVDDADKLQMRFAEYLAECVTSEQICAWSSEVFHLINTQIARYVKEYISKPGLYERVSLQSIVPYLTKPQGEDSRSLLSTLQSTGHIDAAIAATLEKLCHQASQETTTSEEIHAYWLELRTALQPENEIWSIEQWSFCGLDKDLRQAFQQFFWEPYGQHLICGTAITLGALKATFLTRFFGLQENVAFLVDPRPASQILIPSSEDLRPSSYLGRRPWTRSVGNFLYHIAATSKRSLLVSFQTPSIANALAQAFKDQQHETNRQVLSTQLGWTTTKIADRLADETRSTIAFIPPRLREAVLDGPVDVEATGSLRFLNQRDPLVAAHLLLYAKLFPNKNPFSSYLLPQALLELKTRTSSSAKIHIVLDSGLHSKVYHDEVCSLFQQDTLLDNLPGILGEERTVSDEFSAALEAALERWGLSSQTSVDNETLHLALQTYWGTNSFREAPLNQKEIVQAILVDSSDQLVISATGGGKSLCFQLPAILMAQEIVPKVTLVVSPLIALMQDQVEALKNKGVFSAIAWNSTLKPAERKNYLEGIKRGWYSIIYIAPEQIHSASLRKALAMREIGLIAIDEAHCVSQWGHDFRTAYIALKQWIVTRLCDGQKRTFPIIALTATARKGYMDSATGTIEQGTVQEIIENLGLLTDLATVKVTSLERPELEYCVERITLPCPNCQFQFAIDVESVKCPSCGRWCKVEEEHIEQTKVERLIALLAERDGQGLRRRWDRPYGRRQRGLIYCAYTRTTETIVDILRAHPQLAGLNVQAYHGQMSDDVKEWVYNSFIRDDEEGIDIVVATNAFGMGIDIRRLGFVIHFDIPGTLEAYIQEAGRAGRDPVFKQGGEPARCILLYHEHDLEKPHGLNKMNSIDEQGVADVYKALRKFRSRGEREIFVTASEIKSLTDIGESKSQSILYYLERHTRVNGKPLLERGGYAQTEWLFAFEHGYEERIPSPAPRVSSRQLIDVFQNSDAFRLHEREIRMIDGDDLADLLGWEKRMLLGEINNLVNRRILVHANHLLIQWLKRKDEAYQLITQLEQDVSNLLRNIPDQPTFRNGKHIAVDLERLHNEGNLSAVSLPTFTRFLDALSKNTAAPLRLFEHFERALSGNYEMRLVPIEQAKSTCQNIFRQLREVIQCYAPTERSDTWQVLDMLAEEEDYEQRHSLEQGLLLLAKLELLSLQSPQNHEIAMRIMFKQDDVPGDQLDIDLSRLRLVKRHGERKLELMKAYATMPPVQRKSMLHAYFAGEAPLLEPFEMRSDLTEQQQAIVSIAEGYHLVKGPAGSGKTTVLEEHVRFLVEYMLVPHDHILVATHFHSGVDRISNNVKVYQKNGKTISARTLNNLGMSIFLQNRELLLRPDGQTYYAEKAELRLLKSDQDAYFIVEEALVEMSQDPGLHQLQEATLKQKQYSAWLRSPANTVDKCLKGIVRLRQHGIFPTRLIDHEYLYDVLSGLDNHNWADFVYDVYSRYLLLQGDRGICTYDDQILFALVILKADPGIAGPFQRLYEHIIVDEFQDLTPAQSEFIGLLGQKHRNVMAFGDGVQDIRRRADNYQLPSPLVRRFQRISGKTSPTTHNLQTNYRSVQEILDVAGTIRHDVPQVAARGYRGEKPSVIRVNPDTPSPSPNSDVHTMLRAMVKVALDYYKKLPEVDKGSVALMVAISGWSQIVQDCLRERHEPFTVLDHSRYQSQHIGRVLTYFRLIVDDHLDAEIEQLLRYCVAPNFHHWQIKHLKQIARTNEKPLLNSLKDSEILKQINASSEQEAALRQHLEIINTFGPDSRFADVWQAISRLQEGPLAEETTEELQREELEEVLKNFRKQTVAEALKDINRHISFLEEHRTNQQLIVTTIDNAKSQAFDTVFLLGAQALNVNYPNHRARLYVSISRARQRFFFLVDECSDEAQGDDALLPWLQKELHDKLLWL